MILKLLRDILVTNFIYSPKLNRLNYNWY